MYTVMVTPTTAKKIVKIKERISNSDDFVTVWDDGSETKVHKRHLSGLRVFKQFYDDKIVSICPPILDTETGNVIHEVVWLRNVRTKENESDLKDTTVYRKQFGTCNGKSFNKLAF